MGPFKVLLPLLALTVSGVLSQNVEPSSDITVREGDLATLKCTADQPILSCTFVGPEIPGQPDKNRLFTMFAGAKFEKGRIVRANDGDNECGMVINNVKNEDDGTWTCNVVLKVGDEQKQNQQSLSVTVAIPPTVSLQYEDGTPVSSLSVNMNDKDRGKKIQCVAGQARPQPTFIWLLGGVPVNGKTDSIKADQSTTGLHNYIQTFEYNPANNHNGKELACELEHYGFTDAQKAEGSNKASIALEVLYEPTQCTQLEVPVEVGKQKTVTRTIEANPKPSSVVWRFRGKDTPVELEEGNTSGQWIAELEIPVVEEDDLKNGVELVLYSDGEEPLICKDVLISEKKDTMVDPVPADKTGVTVVVVILIIVVLVGLAVTLVARQKGMLCFAPKNNDALDEEKEAFDDPEKGEATPIVVDSKGESKQQPPPPPETAAAAEKKDPVDESNNTTTKESKDDAEKKSNGAHTPV